MVNQADDGVAADGGAVVKSDDEVASGGDLKATGKDWGTGLGAGGMEGGADEAVAGAVEGGGEFPGGGNESSADFFWK